MRFRSALASERRLRALSAGLVDSVAGDQDRGAGGGYQPGAEAAEVGHGCVSFATGRQPSRVGRGSPRGVVEWRPRPPRRRAVLLGRPASAFPRSRHREPNETTLALPLHRRGTAHASSPHHRQSHVVAHGRKATEKRDLSRPGPGSDRPARFPGRIDQIRLSGGGPDQ